MSFSHSDGGSKHSEDSFDSDGAGLVKRMQMKYEKRIVKFNETISVHIEEKDHLSEEIVMWKKKLLDSEETCRDLHLEIKRLRLQVEEFKELADMDEDEDAIREHKLKKVRHHLKELEEKHHHLEKEHAKCHEREEELIHFEVRCHELEEKLKHCEEECHMWEEKFHKVEGRSHEYMEKISIHIRKFKECEVRCGELEAELRHHQEKLVKCEERCHHFEEEMHRFETLCHEWEEKHNHLEGELHIHVEKLKKCEERCEFLDHELNEYREKYQHCVTELHEIKEEHEKCHHLKEELEHCREECHHLREECVRIRHCCKVRCAKLVERLCHLAKVEKEVRSCFSRMQGLCTCKEEDYTEEIVFEEIITTTEHFVEEVRKHK